VTYRASRILLAATIVVHIVVTILHGGDHDGAHVTLSRASRLFVYAVVLAGPPIGLALTWPNIRLGASIVGATMAAALAFGVVNHFVIAGPDHVGHVETQWRQAFATSALLLAATEAFGVVMAVAVIRNTQRLS